MTAAGVHTFSSMIKFLVLVNKQGQTRLARYYENRADLSNEERTVQACVSVCLRVCVSACVCVPSVMYIYKRKYTSTDWMVHEADIYMYVLVC